MGQIVIAAGAAAVGFAAGGTTGAQIGWAIGSALSAPKAPTVHQQQPLIDLRVTGGEYGQAIPYVRGAVGIAGQMWWNTDRRPTTTTVTSGGGGKGGGGGAVETSTTTYDMDCLIGLTDNEIVGIRKIWLNGSLIYTAADDATAGSISASAVANAWTRLTVYTGDAAQLPDPTYEAAVGATVACAYRGRGSVFIQGLALGQSGQVPNLTFEVVADGELGVDTTTARALLHFNGTDGDTATTDDYGNTVVLTNAELSADHPKFGATSMNGELPASGGHATITGPTALGASGWTLEGFVYCDNSPVTFHSGPVVYAVNASGYGVAMWFTGNPYPDQRIFVQLMLSSNGSSNDILNLSPTAMSGTYPTQQHHHWALTRDTSAGKYYLYFDGVKVYETASALEICAITRIIVGGDAGANNFRGYCDEFRFSDSCIYPGGITFTPPTAAFKAQTNGIITIAPPPISDVVSDLCARAGLSAGQIDVTALASITRDVRGLALGQIGSTRAAIELLMSAFFFEMTLSDKLYFVPRGGASQASIPYLDLGARNGSEASGSGDEPLDLRQTNDLEIPAQIALTYINASDDYQSDTQYSDRLVSSAAGTVNAVQMALVMTPAEAKAVADTMLFDQAASLLTTQIALLYDYCRLEPTDAVTVTGGDGSTFRLRLVKKTDAFPIVQFEAVLDDTTVLTSQGITSADYTPGTVVSPPAATLMELMDIPILRDADNDAGFYAATKADSTPYAGSAVFSSPDNVEYTRRATVTESAVFGTCSTTLGDWTGPRVFDEQNSVTLDVEDGTLASSTRAAVLASASVNAMLIGSEIVQFRTAMLVSPGVYTLTGLLRGCRGTEWAMSGHAASERAVLLSTSGLRRIVPPTTDLGVSFYYKGVTIGRALSTATAETFTDNGIGLKPFAPLDLRAARDGSDNITFTWQRRTRLAVRMIGALGISVPLGEDSEAYEVDIYADGTYAAVLRTISATSATCAYSAADQTTDGLTPGDPVYARVYQLSAIVGRGYSLEQAA